MIALNVKSVVMFLIDEEKLLRINLIIAMLFNLVGKGPCFFIVVISDE